MSHHAKIRDLREKSKDDLLKQLTEFKKELSQLRVAQQLNSAGNRLGRIWLIRKSIARILTVLNQNERENLRKFYSDKKLRSSKPKALREKLTRRRRLALKDNEKNRKTRRQLRMAHKYPKRVFAVKI
ncbi:Ribosomal protein L29/L35 [Trypanosoma melophagium]|uniref:Ribosomal protein L29/L35 n=1 Tax=Trypanosoma melophagium TaxID=715481 RepID=UPI00351A4610|nr:Ribosomal protein L29/L35 [Trypanosoma melophagium]KAH9577663.1 Ribosomal protein L29/L35 [Trypanosoma melophagium]